MNRVKLGELLRIKHGYAFKSENYVEKSKYVLVTLANISNSNNFQYNKDKATYYGAGFPDEFKLSTDDLIMPLTEQVFGLFGNSAFVPYVEDVQFVLNQRVGKVVPIEEKADKYYLHYLLATDSVREQLEHRASGTRQRNISPNDVYDVTVFVPDLHIQKAIGKTLYYLEMKINCNKHINDNLAQQAQLLFDFMFQDISGSKHIGDFIVPQRGTALLSKDAIPGDIPVVAGGLVPSTYHNAANTVAPVITISSSGANAGFVNLWGVPVWSSDSSFIDFKMTPYVYFWHALLKRHQNNIYKIQTGSAQPHIYPSHIASLPVCDLDLGKVADYTERVTPLFTLIAKNYKESNQLRALRDWLLPMLMNGQATISD